MKCPFCYGAETKVVDSRDTSNNTAIRRRRVCGKCEKRFSTYEQIEMLNMLVVKRDGSREEYQKEKMEEGIKRATNKRIRGESLKQLTADIESEINCKGKDEISSKEIGNIILDKLKKKDEVAYLRFASVFKSFGSGERFVKEVSKLDEKD
ncbi:MAG: transcriptional regulator NrdR [Candidatus Moranbacteria bacterium]|nr:transcriptional regulator NrdR [Candidatus Moranbacteria bacterium]